jgi:hypothetical protein
MDSPAQRKTNSGEFGSPLYAIMALTFHIPAEFPPIKITH